MRECHTSTNEKIPGGSSVPAGVIFHNTCDTQATRQWGMEARYRIHGVDKSDAHGRPFLPRDEIMDYVATSDRYKDKTFLFSSMYVTSEICRDLLLSTMRRSLFGDDVDDKGNLREEYYGLFGDHLVLDRGVFAFKSSMGTGKSKLIYDYLSPEYMRKLSVLLVSCRVSFASEIARVYTDLGFVNYKEFPDRRINETRVICSLESLKRLVSGEAGLTQFSGFDIVVLDEFETLMSTLTGDTMHDKRAIVNTMLAMLFRHRGTQLICIDGCMTEFTLDVIARKTDRTVESDGSFTGIPRSLFFFYNVYKPVVDGQLKLITSVATLDSILQKKIEENKTAEWNNWEYAHTILGVDRSDYDVHKQIVVAHAVKKIQNSWETMIPSCSSAGGIINAQNMISVDSDSGRMYTNLELWRSKFVIQYTSTIAAGNDYSPPNRDRAITVFVHTGTGRLGSDLMCQMAFRSRFRCVDTYYFYVNGTRAFDPAGASAWDIDEVIAYYNTVKGFADTRLAADMSAYSFRPVNDNGTIVFRGNIVANDECAINFAYNEGKRLRHQASSLSSLVRMFADMSNEWDEVFRKGVIPLSCVAEGDHQTILSSEPARARDGDFGLEFERSVSYIDTPQTLDMRIREKRERCRISQKETRVAIKRWEDDLSDRVFAKIRDLIIRCNSQNLSAVIRPVDMSDMAVVNSSSTDRVVIQTYKVLKMLQVLGIRSLPYAVDEQWATLVKFVKRFFNWFHGYYENIVPLLKGTEWIETNAVKDIVMSKETKYHANVVAVRALFTLQTIEHILPDFVVDMDSVNSQGIGMKRLVCLPFAHGTIGPNHTGTSYFRACPSEEIKFNKQVLKNPGIPIVDFCVQHPARAQYLYTRPPNTLLKMRGENPPSVTIPRVKALLKPVLKSAGIYIKPGERGQRRIRASEGAAPGARVDVQDYLVTDKTFDIHRLIYMSHLIEMSRSEQSNPLGGENLVVWLSNALGDWEYKSFFIDRMHETTGVLDEQPPRIETPLNAPIPGEEAGHQTGSP